MPDRHVHRPLGAVAGGGYAYWNVRERPAKDMFWEILGGAIGGYVGAILPDVIDPPISPHHRHSGHGVANVAGAIWLSADFVLELQNNLRDRADEVRAERPLLTASATQNRNLCHEAALRIAVGFLHGLPAGDVSHLLFDAATPAGLPVFCRGH